MTQDDYLKLAEAGGAGEVLTDAEAALLVNKEFGFEASRIEILHEAEVAVEPEGARYVSLKQVPRRPIYASTDWNYVRFNVRAGGTWYWEMIDGSLYEVCL